MCGVGWGASPPTPPGARWRELSNDPKSDEIDCLGAEIMASRRELSADARRVVLAVYKFFEQNEGKDVAGLFKRRRELVAAATGVSPGTVSNIRNRMRDGGEVALESIPKRPGRPRADVDEVIAAARQIVLQFNLTRRPLSVPKNVGLQGLVIKPGISPSKC